MSKEHITVCICTFNRQQMLGRLLNGLKNQRTEGFFTFSVVVADNDHLESARQVVETFALGVPFEVIYCVEPRKSIALVRNRSLEFATREFIAIIDDDEFPSEVWLLELFKALKQFDASGVLGPVLPSYDESASTWVRQGGFYDRPRFPTGHRLKWTGCRTGNVIFRRSIIKGKSPVFKPDFGLAGSDVNFFMRMMDDGCIFVWSDQAIVHESVPPNRCTARFLIRRALLRGSQSFRHPKGGTRALLKALIAIPAYLVALPFLLLLLGKTSFMKYFVKLFDHGGRLLSLFGYRPVTQRDM